MSRDIKDLAKLFYNTFGKVTDFRTPTGDPMTRWESLPAEYVGAYCDATLAVVNGYGQVVAQPDDSVILPFDDSEALHGAYDQSQVERGVTEAARVMPFAPTLDDDEDTRELDVVPHEDEE